MSHSRRGADQEVPPGILLTKEEAAFNQILAAIDMLRVGRYECATTLAGAAEGMLPTSDGALHEKLMTISVPDVLKHSLYAKLDRQGRNTFWNIERDWLKHSNPNHPSELQIHRRDAESMIARALTKLPAIDIPLGALPTLKGFWQSYLEALEWQPPDGANVEQGLNRFLGLAADGG
jgi:hypothetical protein